MENTPARLRQLDGLRGIAACVIALIFHARLLYGGTIDPWAGVPIINWLQLRGWAMVDLFFVLSGYVFAHCYLVGWKIRANTTLATFGAARIARLWPLHAALLSFAVLVMSSDPATTWQNVILSAVMLQILTPNPAATLNMPAWSLSVEMICYALFACAAVSGPRALKLTAALAIAWGAWDIVSKGIWEALVARGVLGYFAGLILSKSSAITDRIPTAVFVPALMIPLLLDLNGWGLIATVLIAWPAALILSLRSDFLKARIFGWLGDRSYSIYLSHTLIYFVVCNVAIQSGADSRLEWLGVTVIAWLLVLGISDALYQGVERPAQSAILRWYKHLAHARMSSRATPLLAKPGPRERLSRILQSSSERAKPDWRR